MRRKSQQLYQEACAVMPGGVNSPVRAFRDIGITPLIVTEGRGAMLKDVEGESYLDYCCSWGALILGHAPAAVVLAVQAQLTRGSSFGISTLVEQQLAQEVVKLIPSIEKIRFVSSGTEAVMSAIRLARGFTGKSRIVKFNGNYHGHADSLLIQAGSGVAHLNAEASSKGVPPEAVSHTTSLPYNDLGTCRAFLRAHADVAAVLIEPIAGNMGVVPAKREFLQMLQEETRRSGALLIFDEVITGFRVGLQGAQGLYAITPDLTCFGKILGGGFPAAAFGGRAEIMDLLAPLGEVYQAGTLSGNPVAMQAGLATLKELQAPGFYESLEQKSENFAAPLQEAIQKRSLNACLQRRGSMMTLFFGVKQVEKKEDLAQMDAPLFKRFFLHLFENGIYIPPSPYEALFISSAHADEHLEKTRACILEFLHTLC